MAELYPLKFAPILKERVWGGNALQNKYGKDAPEEKKIGESWEISGLQGDLSVVSNGYLAGNNLEEIAEVYMGDLLGDRIYEKFGKEFPLLIKLIEARDRLSLQVHPDDSIAKERHNAYGKTEMWYILEADKNSFIQTGFKDQTGKEEFNSSLKNKSLENLMNTVKPDAGDVFYIPAGRVHTLGDGVLLAEIQQTSDITYRIHDWDRMGLDGLARELHIDLAEDAIDYTASTDHLVRITPEINKETELLSCPYFNVNIIKLESTIEKDYSKIDSFVVYLCVDGTVEISSGGELFTLSKGETILIPATTEILKLNSEGANLLEIYIYADELKEEE